MGNRPLGMSLLSGFFGLAGFASVVSALFITGAGDAAPVGTPESVQLFITVLPLYLVVWGFLGWFVAIALWAAHPLGRIGGLVWIGGWLLEEVLMGIWGTIGPELVQQAANGVGGVLLRIVIGGAIGYYLWTAGEPYVHSASS